MTTIDQRVRERLTAEPVIQTMLQEMEVARQRDVFERAQENPEKYRKSTLIADHKPANYRYYVAKKTKSSEHRWCYAVNKNIAGYYLVWYEIETDRQIKRSRITSEKKRKDASELCRMRAKK